jgi:hypothetical protein
MPRTTRTKPKLPSNRKTKGLEKRQPPPRAVPPPQAPVPPSIPPDEAAAPPALAVGRVLSTVQFWALMARWQVADDVALALVAYPDKLGASGKRPRFRFSTRQQRITSYLAEIDSALTAAGENPDWLHKHNRAAPLGGRTPLACMIADGVSGSAGVLRFLNRAVFRATLAG